MTLDEYRKHVAQLESDGIISERNSFPFECVGLAIDNQQWEYELEFAGDTLATDLTVTFNDSQLLDGIELGFLPLMHRDNESMRFLHLCIQERVNCIEVFSPVSDSVIQHLYKHLCTRYGNSTAALDHGRASWGDEVRLTASWPNHLGGCAQYTYGEITYSPSPEMSEYLESTEREFHERRERRKSKRPI